MEIRLIVLFLCAVCCVTEAQLLTPTPLTSTITLTGCGTTKLCVFSSANCDPSGNSSCYFSSTQFSNGVLTVELSGTTSGYVGLGLTGANNQTQTLIQGATGVGPSIVFVCANNNTAVNGSFFFQPNIQNSMQLNAININVSQVNITSIEGSVTANQTVVQCVFKATIISNFTSLPFNVTILNGTTNGTLLAAPSTVLNSNTTLNLADPMSNIPNNSTSNNNNSNNNSTTSNNSSNNNTSTTTLLNITRTGCGSSKLCFSSGSNCDPAGTSSCFFGSVQSLNQTFLFELSGTTSGYVALGLTKAGSTVVFACGNNSNVFFFQTASQNGTSLTPANVSTVYSSQGVVAQNQTLIQCIFNTSTTFNITTKADDTSFTVSVLNGTTNGTLLEAPSTVFNSNTTLNLANPMSNIPSNTTNNNTSSTNNNTTLLNITRTGCGSSKLCFSSGSNCDPAGTSSCFFGSSRLVSQTFLFELSGTTSGYVALGLTKAGSTVVFACGNNSNVFFFQTASQNGTSLTPANVSTVYSSQGVVAQNQTLIQCIFNTSTTFNITTKADDTAYVVTILNGTTNGTTLEVPTTQYNSSNAIDLSNPSALNTNTDSAASVCVNVVTVLLSILTLWILG